MHLFLRRLIAIVVGVLAGLDRSYFGTERRDSCQFAAANPVEFDRSAQVEFVHGAENPEEFPRAGSGPRTNGAVRR